MADDDSGFTDDPWESGIPGDNYSDNVYEDFVDEYNIRGDEYAETLLYEGWFNREGDADTRVAAREAFYEYMYWDEDDNEFDWDAWREWYNSD